MRILFAGASGVIGRRLLPRLLADGHDLTALTRTPGKATELEAAGAKAVVADALDRDQLLPAVVGAKPEAVIHHLTDVSLLTDPKLASNPRRLGEAYKLNDRLRREGTANLVAAAEAAGAKRIVAQSISFVYAPGPGLRTEGDPLAVAAPAPFDKSVAAVESLESAVVGAAPEGLALRFGFWYGPGTGFASDGASAALVSKRRYPVVGKGSGVFSFVHIDDVVEATVAALDSGKRGVYNVVDDDPAPMREWLPAYAAALGAKPPRRIPLWLAKIFAGEFTGFMTTAMPGVSNEKAKRELAWEPRWPSWRTGFREALG
jgi:nucleoside-diphosphate-sugar epimerase